MSDWTSGYVADIEYSAQYFLELNPARMSIALLNAGFVPPVIKNACELGFGQGLSINAHAAAQAGVKWYGNDFNPTHAAFAAGLAEQAGSGAELTDESFEEFFARDDLPDFDYIGLHGVWTWISDENRARIADFIKRKLRVGGMVYVSYNVLPGWAPALPMRELFVQHASQMSPPSMATEDKVGAAIEFVEGLFATSPIYAQANPSIAERVKAIRGQDKRYVAHEYFNRDWKPMYFMDMARVMSDAKLTFACSAFYGELVDDIWLTPEQQAFLGEVPSDLLTQQIRDYMVNQQFRKDIWIKGGETLSLTARMARAAQERVVMTTRAAEIPMTITMSGREVKLQETIYRPIIDFLADHRAVTIGELQAAVADRGIEPAQVLQALVVMIGAQHIAPARADKAVVLGKPGAARFNAAVADRARFSDDPPWIASPVTGGAVNLDRIVALMLGAYLAGATEVEALAAHAWNALAADGRRIVKDGQTLETAEENMAEMRVRATEFLKIHVPHMRALGALGDAHKHKQRAGR